MSFQTKLLACSCIFVCAHAAIATADDVVANLAVPTYVTVQSLESAKADGMPQPVAAANCVLIANEGGPTANCSNYQDRTSTDIGYYFGFKTTGAGGKGVEVDLADAQASSNGAGGWAQNPLNTFYPGAGDGSVTQILLDNQNPKSGQEYDGLVLEGSGTGNDLAAISANGVGTIWRKGYWIENGVQTDGVLDTSNSWTGIMFGSSHDSGLSVDAGTVLSQGLIVLPATLARPGTNSQLAWTQQNGTVSGNWSVGPSRANGSECGFCVQTPASPWGAAGEVDALSTGGLSLTGSLSYGSAHGVDSINVEQALSGQGTQILLTPDGHSESATDNVDTVTPYVASSDGTGTRQPAVFARTLSMVVACSGGNSAPVVWKIDAILGSKPSRVLSQSATRLVGSGPSATVTLAVDALGNALAQVASTTRTTCVASTHTINNLDSL